MPLHALPDITHHNIDKSILYEAEKNEDGAGWHEYVNGLSGSKSIKTVIQHDNSWLFVP